MSDNLANLDSLFGAAIEIESADERAAYLDQCCGADLEKRRRLEKLLDAHFRAGSFLGAPAVGQTATVDQEVVSEKPGTVIGPYKLKEQIGEGGFGLVFVAEQQEPVRRRVALKIIKPGMDTREVIARFEAERQALALMEHPNIARVFDGGATASGRPYFVMELVKGIPIVEYCDQQQLTARERLELFVVVCLAVQHAHAKGIIHRDLKPSNILVAPHDGVPVVKVIDFGIAKAIGQQLTEKSIYTRWTQMIGTPLYMSPEQAEINALDVDIRSDVYSLGVLLYELLTGTTPFDRERFAKAAYDEIRRIIREEEPPKPSTRLSNLGERLSKVSEQRKAAPAKLSALVKGDLDWIVMKALEKDRTRRYETASGLAKDVQRFLKDEAVEACPPSAWYRFRKMARRNRAAVTTVALVAAALLLGFVVSAWQTVRATRAEQTAWDAERRALEAWNQETEERRKAIDQLNRAVIAEADARDKEKLAEDNATKAEENAARAAKNAQVAAEQAERAEFEKQQAILARLKAQENETKAEWGLYASQMGTAQKELQRNNFELYYDMLDRSRPDFRGWEHNYLYTLANHNHQTLRGHANSVTRVAFSPNGKVVASASLDDTVKIWDADNGRVIHTLKGHKDHVWGVAFSPDGNRLASACNVDVTLWNVLTGKEVLKLPAPDYCVAFSPDGKHLVTAGRRYVKKGLDPDDALYAVTLWDVNSGRQLSMIIKGQTDSVYNVAFSPDGRRLATTSGGMVKLWELTSGKEYLALEGHMGTVPAMKRKPNGKREVASTVYSVAFSPNGKLLATASDDKTVKLWDAANGKELLTLTGHTAGVSSVAFSPDGKRLASASDDKTVKLWDAANGKEIRTLRGHLYNVNSVAFSPDGNRLASGSVENTVKLWDLAGVQEAPGVTFRHDGGSFHDMAFNPDCKLLACAVSDDNKVKLWDAASGKVVRSLEGLTGKDVSVTFSPNGKLMASISYDAGQLHEMKLWDLASGQEMRTLQKPTPAITRFPFPGVAFSPDGKLLLTQGPGLRTLKVWDTASGEVVQTIDDQDLIGFDKIKVSSIWCVAFSPDGKSLGTASRGIAKLWDLASGKVVKTLKLINGIAYSPFNLNPAAPSFMAFSIAFSPDGKFLVSDSLDTVKLWDLASGQVVLTLNQKGVLHHFAFTPDGKRLAIAPTDNTFKLSTVNLWELATGQEVLTLQPGSFGSLAFSADGKRLASCGRQEITIWDASRSMPVSSDAYTKFGIALAAKNHLDEAIRAFRNAIDIDPKYVPAYFNLGNALREKHLLEKAIDAYRKVIDIDPRRITEAYYNLGNALQDNNQLDEAIDAYRKAIAAYNAFRKAKAAFEFFLDTNSRLALAYYSLGNALRDNNQLDEAIDAYRKSIDIDPEEAKAHNNLAWLLATCADQKRRKSAAALASAKKAVDLDPKNGNHWTTLGTAYYRSDEWQKAIAALDKAVSLKQALPLAGTPPKQGGTSSDFFFLAMAHWQLGHADQAREWYDKGVQWMTQNRPKDDEMQRFRAEAAELLGLQILDPLSKDATVPKK